MYTIYIHRIPNGKVYVGCTSKSIRERRWLGYQGEFGLIIKQYGWDSITTEILDTTTEQSESAKLEAYYIKLYQADNPKFGYNKVKAIGGKTQTCLEKLSKSALRAHANEETHRKLCEAQQIAQNRPEVRRLKSESSKKAMTKPGMHEKLSDSAKSAWNKPEIRQKLIDSHKGIRLMHLGNKAKQVKPEFIDDYLSQGWELGGVPGTRRRRRRVL